MNSKLSIAHHIELLAFMCFFEKYIIIIWYWPGSNPASFLKVKSVHKYINVYTVLLKLILNDTKPQ